MKYLELSCTSRVSGEMRQMEETIPGLSIRLETYSLKKTRKEKKDSRSCKYKSVSAMVSAALNQMFFGYDISLAPGDITEITESEAKGSITGKLFTLGITRDYSKMTCWVSAVFDAMRAAIGNDGRMVKLEKSSEPFDTCIWSECIAVYGKEQKRMCIFITLFRGNTHSPIL